MISYPAPPVDPGIRERVRTAAQAGSSAEELIRLMRDCGLAKIPCIRLLREYLSLPAEEAKGLVHLSPVWHDCYNVDEMLHDTFQAALEVDTAGEQHVPEHAA